MFKAILIDDELHCTESLRLLLTEHFADRISVSGTFNKPAEALRYLLAHKVDLIFLDIEMPEMNGFELLNKLMPYEADVVFVTAYDQVCHKGV
ncbi:LytR/AlgR family response regulator transcription factor [Phnomibacter ginsenosidimutans]|uniref:Response regulator n=1 Tax=Phnomibacter ginsenosidimutans TaxID=2676868 RepID=A0A6I6GW48_9BACT|nr:response regulator [Phnomibacter ginsenosidimutans]QGW26861.1 response regulator [Phnomibacter ginsenosidimutans]